MKYVSYFPTPPDFSKRRFSDHASEIFPHYDYQAISIQVKIWYGNVTKKAIDHVDKSSHCHWV